MPRPLSPSVATRARPSTSPRAASPSLAEAWWQAYGRRVAVTRLLWLVKRGTLNQCMPDYYVPWAPLSDAAVRTALAAHAWPPVIAGRLRGVSTMGRLADQERELVSIIAALNTAWRGARDRVNTKLPEKDRVALWVRALTSPPAPPTVAAPLARRAGPRYATLWRTTLRQEVARHMVRDVVDGVLPITALAHLPHRLASRADDAIDVTEMVADVLERPQGQERRIRAAVARWVETPVPDQEPDAALTQQARDATLTAVQRLGSLAWMTEMKRACSVALESLVLTHEAIEIVPWINDKGLPVPSRAEVERLADRCPVLPDDEVAQMAVEDMKETVPGALIDALVGAGVAWPIVRRAWERIPQPRLRAAIAHAVLTRDTAAALGDGAFLDQAVDAYMALTSREDRTWIADFAALDLVDFAGQALGGVDPQRWCALVAMIPVNDDVPATVIVRLLSKAPLWADWPLRPTHLVPLLSHRSAAVRLYVQSWLATLPADDAPTDRVRHAGVPVAPQPSPPPRPRPR